MVGLLGLLAAACGGDQPTPEAKTQRERDSAIGASAIPGASGVSTAQKAADSAAARKRLQDSIAANP